MKSTHEDNASHPIIPPDQRCVWMTAGILSYQLCDREFDCEHCPLDGAMQMHFSRDSNRTRGHRPPSELPAEGHHENDHLYGKNHCWVKVLDEDTVRVGLEPKFASILFAPKAIALPSLGDTVRRDESCCWIILEGGTLPVSSPVDGIICATNARIYDEPHKLSAHPFTQGWLFEVQLQREVLQTSNLLMRIDADKCYAEDVAHFSNALIEALKSDHLSVGETLADGGQALQDVSQMLGPRRYFELVKKSFCK